MNLIATALVTNEYNQLLLVQKDNSAEWAAPSGTVAPGELPTVSVARKTHDATGIKIYPVRLAAATFEPGSTNGSLHLIFRCLQKGGDLPADQEPPQAGFFPATGLPQEMNADHRQQVALAIYQAGPPHVKTLQPTLSKKVRRWLKPGRQPQTQDWSIDVLLIAVNSAGEVAVTPQNELPRTTCRPGEAPWEAAGRLAADSVGNREEPGKISAFFIIPDSRKAVVVFYKSLDRPLNSPNLANREIVVFSEGSPPADLIMANHEFVYFGVWGKD